MRTRNPPDKALSPLRGPRDGGIDEVALIVDGGYVVGVFTCAPNLPILLHLVAQDFLIDYALFNVKRGGTARELSADERKKS